MARLDHKVAWCQSQMMLLGLLWHPPLTIKKELDHKHNTDNFLNYIQKRRRHSRYVQNNNNTQVEVDLHHDSVPFQLSSSNHIYSVDN